MFPSNLNFFIYLGTMINYNSDRVIIKTQVLFICIGFLNYLPKVFSDNVKDFVNPKLKWNPSNSKPCNSFIGNIFSIPSC
ncbi:hypothetical protein HanPSC8_Chr03g0101211 [Helianthus annuus]|nr:hypothetical protein HanPSC8_Chr03g0101211 [Helianthus annuus]